MTEEPPNYPPPSYPPPSYPPPSYPPPTPNGYGNYGGYGYPPAYQQFPGRSTNSIAIASFIACIAGFFTCGIGTILGLVFGLVALSQIKRTGEGGRGLAIAGIVISAITLVFLLLALILGSISRHNRHHDDTYDSQHAMVVIPAEQHLAALGRIFGH